VGAGPCGFAGAGVVDTWVQYPGDDLSNSHELSQTFKDKILSRAPWLVPDFTGDCFHPNIFGAEELANEVEYRANQMLGNWSTGNVGGAKLAITATSEDDAALPSACFEIYRDEGDGVRGDRVGWGCDGSDGLLDGVTHLDRLPGDEYLLVE